VAHIVVYDLLSEALYYRGLRIRVVILWNANNTFGFHRIKLACPRPRRDDHHCQPVT